MQPTQPRPLHPHRPRVILALHRHNTLPAVQNRKPENDLQTRNTNGHNNQEDDDPGDASHFLVADAVAQNLAKVEEDLAALVEDLDAWLDLEVFADGGVEGVQGGLRVPEEGRVVEEVGCWELLVRSLEGLRGGRKGVVAYRDLRLRAM
jgi:hypothetical protein